MVKLAWEQRGSNAGEKSGKKQVIIGNIFHTCKETKNAKTLENKGFSVIFNGDPGGIRTPDPRLRRPLLYPTELLNHIDLERAMGIEPTTSAWKAEVLPLNYTRKKIWSEWQDLNLRHPAPKAGALPNCATPRLLKIVYYYSNKKSSKILLFFCKFSF